MSIFILFLHYLFDDDDERRYQRVGRERKVPRLRVRFSEQYDANTRRHRPLKLLTPKAPNGQGDK